jgi:hypothetical protein
MRKSLSLLVATVAAASSIFVAAPAQAWTCQTNDEVIPEVVGDAACEVVLTVAGALCKVKVCFY